MKVLRKKRRQTEKLMKIVFLRDRSEIQNCRILQNIGKIRKYLQGVPLKTAFE